MVPVGWASSDFVSFRFILGVTSSTNHAFDKFEIFSKKNYNDTFLETPFLQFGVGTHLVELVGSSVSHTVVLASLNLCLSRGGLEGSLGCGSGWLISLRTLLSERERSRLVTMILFTRRKTERKGSQGREMNITSDPEPKP